MKQILRQLDSLIARVKLCENLARVRFIRDYGTHSAESPVTGFLAVVSLTDTSLSKQYIGEYLESSIKGEQFTAKVEINVYAPASENGNGLSEVISELMSTLKKVDNEKILRDITASPIEFDADINSIFRKVEFMMDFCLCEEV